MNAIKNKLILLNKCPEAGLPKDWEHMLMHMPTATTTTSTIESTITRAMRTVMTMMMISQTATALTEKQVLTAKL
jgi:hypothetical protein